jgi:hypothetical protein
MFLTRPREGPPIAQRGLCVVVRLLPQLAHLCTAPCTEFMLVRARLCASMREYTVASRALELVHTSDSNWFLACCRLATVFSVSACRFAKAST